MGGDGVILAARVTPEGRGSVTDRTPFVDPEPSRSGGNIDDEQRKNGQACPERYAAGGCT